MMTRFKHSHVSSLLVALAILLSCFQGASTQAVVSTRAARVALAQPLTLRWRYDSNLTLNLTPAFDEQSIYVPLSGGIIVSLKAADGRLQWRSEFGGELSASPVADGKQIYVASEITGDDATKKTKRATGTLRALGSDGGLTQWMRTLAVPLKGSLTIKNNSIFGGGGDGRLYSFDTATGTARWGFEHSAAFNGQPVIANSRVYVGSEDGNLLALDENTGKLLWRFKTKGPVRGPVGASEETVFFGSGDGYVYAVHAATGKLKWKTRTGAGVQAVALVENSLLVASLDNFVYLYSHGGKRIWKRQLPGRISSQPFTTTDGALFTPLSSSAAVVLGLSDGRPVNSLPTEEEMGRSASPIAVGDAVFLTTQSGLLAFAEPAK
jgi:eukaryotic-like serine/threonine-protein kinase